ncbi:unnamed protein product [Boreogadus saida]
MCLKALNCCTRTDWFPKLWISSSVPTHLQLLAPSALPERRGNTCVTANKIYNYSRGEEEPRDQGEESRRFSREAFFLGVCELAPTRDAAAETHVTHRNAFNRVCMDAAGHMV